MRCGARCGPRKEAGRGAAAAQAARTRLESIQVEGKAHAVRGELQAGRREAAGDCGARSMHRGEGAAADWGAGRAEVHLEHFAHCRDAGRVEVQRLVKRKRALRSKTKAFLRRGARCGPGGRRGLFTHVAQTVITTRREGAP